MKIDLCSDITVYMHGYLVYHVIRIQTIYHRMKDSVRISHETLITCLYASIDDQDVQRHSSIQYSVIIDVRIYHSRLLHMVLCTLELSVQLAC